MSSTTRGKFGVIVQRRVARSSVRIVRRAREFTQIQSEMDSEPLIRNDLC